MPFKWDSESERNLLLFAIAEMAAPPSSIWPKVADKLGHGLNGNACSQKFYKLKKESEKILTGTSGDDADATPATPKTRTPRTPKTTGGATKRKRNAAAEDVDSPSKKVKEENDDDDANVTDTKTNMEEP